MGGYRLLPPPLLGLGLVPGSQGHGAELGLVGQHREAVGPGSRGAAVWGDQVMLAGSGGGRFFILGGVHKGFFTPPFCPQGEGGGAVPLLPPRRPHHRHLRQDGDGLRPPRWVRGGGLQYLGGGQGSKNPPPSQPRRPWCGATKPTAAPCCRWRPTIASSCRAARTGPSWSSTAAPGGSCRSFRWVPPPPFSN